MRVSDSRIKPASYQGIDVSGKIVPQVTVQSRASSPSKTAPIRRSNEGRS